MQPKRAATLRSITAAALFAMCVDVSELAGANFPIGAALAADAATASTPLPPGTPANDLRAQ